MKCKADILIKQEGKYRHIKFLTPAAKEFATRNNVPNSSEEFYEFYTTPRIASRVAHAALVAQLTVEYF